MAQQEVTLKEDDTSDIDDISIDDDDIERVESIH